MTRRRKARLRVLTTDEQTQLEQLSRAHSAPTAQVSRAKMLLAVAEATEYTERDYGLSYNVVIGEANEMDC